MISLVKSVAVLGAALQSANAFTVRIPSTRITSVAKL
jgi:hypothetical protein